MLSGIIFNSYDDIKPIYLNNIPLDATEADEELTELSPSDYAPYEVWESGEESLSNN